MAGLLLGLAAMQIASAVIPLAVGGLSVSRPKRVDIRRARQESGGVAPVIPYYAPRPYTGGRVRALLIGINYRGTSSQLNGCVNDVRQMLGTLQKITFPISECCILVDDTSFPNYTAMPTRANIIRYMAWLTTDVRPGDVLFLHYSGHGGQTKSTSDSAEEYDQCLIPLDYKTAGSILDDDLFLLLVAGLPPGVRMTCVFDCCHSATMLDLPFQFSGNNPRQSGPSRMLPVRRDNYSFGDVILFSGCADDGTSADVARSERGEAGGAATQAFTWALLNTQGFSYVMMLQKTREILKQKKFKQVTQLTSSKPIDVSAPFSLFGTIAVDQAMMRQYVPPKFQPPPQQQQQPYQPPSPQPYPYPYPPGQPAVVMGQPIYGPPPGQQQARGGPPPSNFRVGEPQGVYYPPTAYPPDNPHYSPRQPPPQEYTYNPHPL